MNKCDFSIIGLICWERQAFSRLLLVSSGPKENLFQSNLIYTWSESENIYLNNCIYDIILNFKIIIRLMLVSYVVTDVKSLITLIIYTGRCYCHAISGRCSTTWIMWQMLLATVADGIANLICIMFILMADVIAMCLCGRC